MELTGISTVRPDAAEARRGAAAVRPPEEPALGPGPLAAPSRWNAGKRVGFRFVLLYFVLYILPFPLGWLPFTGWLAGQWDAAFVSLVIRAGELAGWTVVVQPTGSGDTLYGYVAMGVVGALAAAGTAVWTLLDRRRREYGRLHAWLRILVRFFLGRTMILYGVAKVIPTQFPYPSPDRLTQPLGEFSPMGLLWTFMGYSAAYNVFAGLGELVGGALLFFRRTATLGALLTIAVMANVVVLNFAYDVPVKLFSVHLLLMAVFIAAPDVPAMLRLLVLRRPTTPVAHPSPLPARVRVAAAVVAVLLLGHTLRTQFAQGMTYRRMVLEEPAFHGVWDVERLERYGGAGVAPGEEAGSSWSRIGFGRARASITLAGGGFERFLIRDDTLARTLTWTGRDDPGREFVLRYSRPDADRIVFAGRVDGDSVEASLRRAEWRDYLLVRRGFNWVQELPYNR